MSVHRKDARWVVRWRAEARQRSKSFATKREAMEFERLRQRDVLLPTTALTLAAVTAEMTADQLRSAARRVRVISTDSESVNAELALVARRLDEAADEWQAA